MKGKNTSNKIFSFSNSIVLITVFIISAVCLIGMVLSIISFITSQRSFNDNYTNTIDNIKNTINENDSLSEEYLSSIISHMESLQVVQKNSTTNDLMSFIYGILSTILVGLCASSVAKSKKSAEESKKTAEQAQDSVKTIESTKKDILKIKNNIIIETKKAKRLRTYAEEQISVQTGNTKILDIHISIAHAKIALSLCNQVEANSRIYQIYESIQNFDNHSNKQALKRLRDELLILKSSVDSFKYSANQVLTAGKQTSMLQSVSRYYEELDESINKCDYLLRRLN